MFLSPRQVHPFYKVANGDDSLGGHCAAIDGCHVSLGFGLDVCGWTFPACRDLADCMGNPLPLDDPADISAFPIPNVPAISNANDLSLLFAVLHISYSPPFLLRSRAATAAFAIRLNSALDNFAALAFPPLLAILMISAGDRALALALPPKRPSACAFGFFFLAMPGGLSYLAVSTSRGKCGITVASSPAIPLAGVIPIQTGHSGQAGRRGFVHLSGFVRECGSESKIPGLATAPLTPGSRSIPHRSRVFGTSMGHLELQDSCFHSLSCV